MFIRRDYIKDLLQQFGMSECKPMSTPLDIHMKLSRSNTGGAWLDTSHSLLNSGKPLGIDRYGWWSSIQSRRQSGYSCQILLQTMKRKMIYRDLVEGLMYLTTGSRLDIAHAASQLNQFNNCYRKIHWNIAKWVLRYLTLNSHWGHWDLPA